MHDVFVSYAGEDRAHAVQLARALEARGLSVWWDRQIPAGVAFDDAIESALNAAGCVLVLWTARSIQSRWVRTEASAALERDRLVPALIENVSIPLEFRRIQAANLTQWHSGQAHDEFEMMVHSIERMLGRTTAGDHPAARASSARSFTSAPVSRRRLAIVAAVIAVAIGAWWGLYGSGESIRKATDPFAAGEQQPGKQEAAQSASSPKSSAPSADPPTAGAASTAPPPGLPHSGEAMFAIKIGDRIEDDAPAAGAGVIAAAYSETVYWFDAPARESVFFRVRKLDAGLGSVRWKLVDGTGRELFNTCLGCTTPGVIELRQAGRYTLTVGGGDGATGAYSLQLTRVPPPQRSSLELSRKPLKVAGVVEAPGARNLYTFTAPPKTRLGVYSVRMDAGMDSLQWRLADGDDETLFDTCLGCTHPGVFELQKGGKYALSVGGNADPATGAYTFQILSVPLPTRIGLGPLDGIVRIGPDRPVAGAGEIESPGGVDVYEFTVPTRAQVAVRILKVDSAIGSIGLQITDENDNVIFASCLGCSEPGALTLSRAGAYALTVGSTRDPATGTYELQIGRIR